MYRLRRLRFERIGHSDARFRSLVLDLTSGEVAVADESDNRSVDAIVWLRNGGGKSSLLALLYSLLLPAKVDFIGHSKKKSLADYVVGGAAAHVIAEWEDDTELWAGPVLIIGAVYQWKNGHRPRDLEHAWDDLIRRWYLFRPIPGVLTLDTLPIRDDGRLSLHGYLKAVTAVMEANHRIDLLVAKDQTQWEDALTNVGLDPRIFKIQRDMNRDEGAITELFSFDTPEKFTDFLIDLVVDPSLPTEVRKNLEQQARTIAQRPARELEKRFLSTAVLRLRPVRDAALATATNARELMKISAAIDLAREHLLARAATRDADAGLADTAVGEAQRKANEEYRRRNRCMRRVAALARVVSRLTIGEAEQRRKTAEDAVAAARLEERAWQAVTPVIDAAEKETQHCELTQLIAAQDQRAAPLRAARLRAGAALRDRLRAAKASVEAQREDAAEQAGTAEADAKQAGHDRDAALAAASVAAATAAQARTTLAELDNAERQARTAGHVNVAETVAEAVVRYTDEQGQATDGRHSANARAEAITSELETIDTERRGRAIHRRDVQEQHDATWDTISRLTEQRRTLARHPRLIELATVDADEGVELDVAGARLAKLLDQQVDHAESQLVAEEVSAAEDRRAQLALTQTHFLPPPLEIEYAVQALTAAGATAISGLQFLRDTIPADRHAEVIDAMPHIIGGVVIVGEPPDDLPTLVRKANLTTTAVIQVTVDHIARQFVATTVSPASANVVLPLRPALLDRQAADVEEHALQIRIDGLDGRRRKITDEREADRQLASELRGHLKEFGQGRCEELTTWLDRLAEELEEIDAAEKKAAALHGRLVDERKQANATAHALTARLETLAGLLPGLRDLAERIKAVPQFRQTAADADAECQHHTDLAEQQAERAERAQVTAIEQHRVAALRGADVERYDAEERSLDVPDDAAHDLNADELTAHPLDLLRSRFADAERMWQSAIGDSALHMKTAMLKEQLDRLQADLKDFTPRELLRADALRGTPDAVEPERRRAATAKARDRSQDSEAEYAEAKTLLKQAKDAERSLPAAPPRDDTDGVDLDPGPLDYPDAAAARLAYDQADSEANAARSAANSFDQLRSDNLAAAESARAEAAAFRGSERVLAATVASLPASETTEPDTSDAEETFERETGRRTADAPLLTVKDLPLLEQQLQAALSRRLEAYRAAQDELARTCRQLQGFAQQPEYARVVDRRLVDRLADDPEILRRKIDQLIEDVKLRERSVAAKLAAIEQDQLLLVKECGGLVKSVFDDLDQVSRHSTLPKGLGHWSGQRFLGLEMAGWGTEEELARRLSLEIDRMVAMVGAGDSAKATALPEPMAMTKRLVLAALGGSGHVVAKVLKPKPTLAVERVSVTQIQKFSGGELLTVSVMLYCILARLRAANRGKRLPGGVGTLVLDNPFSRATYVLFLKLQRQVAAAHGIQLIYATAVRDLLAVGQFPLILRLRNGTDERTRVQYVQVVERFGDAVRDGVVRAQEDAVIGTRLHRAPALTVVPSPSLSGTTETDTKTGAPAATAEPTSAPLESS